MPSVRLRHGLPVLLLVFASVLLSCSGGSGGDQGASTTSSTTAATGGSASTTAPSTTVAVTVSGSSGVWLGGDPVGWARTACLSANADVAGAADRCGDFPATATWRTKLVGCLAENGLQVTLDGDSLPAPLVRFDLATTAKAWAACRAVYARATGAPAARLGYVLAVPDCMATKGWLLVLSEGPSSRETAFENDLTGCQPPDPRQQVVLCLRAQGATVADLPTVGSANSSGASSATTRGDPAVTAKAWAACRTTYIAAMGMPEAMVDTYLATPDCMATKGWLIVVMSGPPSDMQAYTADSDACRRQAAPSDPRVKVAQCLRANGVDVPDPASPPTTVPGVSGAPGTTVGTSRYPAELAAKAWAACRGTYIAATGMPEAMADTYLATPDCMATKGWLIVVMAGPPTDMQAYNAAMSECTSGATAPPTTRPGPQRYPTLTNWVQCFREHGVPVADPSAGVIATSSQVFAGSEVSSAFAACVALYGGILENTPAEMMACVAKAGVVPGLTGPGTAAALARCGVSASYLSGREPDDAQQAFFRCLVDNGVPLHPLLRTIDSVLAPWLRCRATGTAGSEGFTILNPDRTEADLAVLRYWDCLAVNGLMYPDVRRTTSDPAPDLERARRAVQACRNLAVIVARRSEEFSGD